MTTTSWNTRDQQIILLTHDSFLISGIKRMLYQADKHLSKLNKRYRVLIVDGRLPCEATNHISLEPYRKDARIWLVTDAFTPQVPRETDIIVDMRLPLEKFREALLQALTYLITSNFKRTMHLPVYFWNDVNPVQWSTLLYMYDGHYQYITEMAHVKFPGVTMKTIYSRAIAGANRLGFRDNTALAVWLISREQSLHIPRFYICNFKIDCNFDNEHLTTTFSQPISVPYRPMLYILERMHINLTRKYKYQG